MCVWGLFSPFCAVVISLCFSVSGFSGNYEGLSESASAELVLHTNFWRSGFEDHIRVYPTPSQLSFSQNDKKVFLSQHKNT